MSKQSYPEPVVGAFILNKKGKIFLMKSHKWSNLFVVPGGHINFCEKAEDALKREIREETGLDIYDIKFICLWDFIEEGEYWKNKHMLFLDFSARTNSDQACLNDEAESYIWIYPKDALKLPLEKYTKITIEKYMC